MKKTRHPLLYQINTRVYLNELSEKLNRAVTLDDIPDAELERLAKIGFEWIWFLSVWQTGPAGRLVSRRNREWRHEFEQTLPDLQEEDIAGSGFAITAYTVHENLGGDAALSRLRQRMRKYGLKLLLDFVPNHTALDHPWVCDHPEYYISGAETDLLSAPGNYTKVKGKAGDLILAHGRDPYFSGWPDTLQLDWANPATAEAMMGELMRIAGQCDGVRCDMSMLILPEIFARTWGKPAQLFWPKITTAVREKYADFCFMAEVYWDMEWTLQEQGFDYTYDKRLYDRLREGHTRSVRQHLQAARDYQDKMARFLENHDEARASAVFSFEMHRAAAVVSFLTPGLRFFHDGQLQGKLKRISPHLVRGPIELVHPGLQVFYQRLLSVLREPLVHEGEWQLLDCRPAWDGNWTWDCFLCFVWRGAKDEHMLVVVNYADNQSQCRINLPFNNLGSDTWLLQDQLQDQSHDITYRRSGADLCEQGLYLDMQPWQAHIFVLAKTCRPVCSAKTV